MLSEDQDTYKVSENVLKSHLLTTDGKTNFALEKLEKCYHT